MPLFEAVRLALIQIRVQKLKSFFTLLGVMIGVMFLIAVVSIVEGMGRYMEDDFAGRLLGANTFTLRRFPWFGNNTTQRAVARVAAPAAHLRRRRRVRSHRCCRADTRWAIESQSRRDRVDAVRAAAGKSRFTPSTATTSRSRSTTSARDARSRRRSTSSARPSS